MCASLAHNTVLHPGESMKNVALGQEEIPFCALSLLTMTSLRNPWQVLQDTAQAISSDGAYVPLVSGEWAEVRAAAIGEVETHTSAQGKAQVMNPRMNAGGLSLPLQASLIIQKSYRMRQ